MRSKTISTILIDTFSIPLPSVAMSNKEHREDTLTRALGITALAILILVGVAGAAPFAYVASIGIDTGTVFVIDTATNNLTAVVPIEGWAGQAAINPAGTKVYVTDSSGFSTTVSVIDTATNTVTATVNSGKYTMNCPVGVVIGSFRSSDMTDQSIKATYNETDQSTMETLNATEDIGVGVEETNLSSSEEKNAVELNNSNNNNDTNNSESDNGSSSGENESSKNNSTSGFGLLGSLTCLYGRWKLRKK